MRGRRAGDKPAGAGEPREAPEAAKHGVHGLHDHDSQYADIRRRATREGPSALAGVSEEMVPPSMGRSAKMAVMTHKCVARETLDDARAYLELAQSANTVTRAEFVRHLKSAIIYGRSVTFHIKKEFKHHPLFAAWYADQQTQMRADPLFTFFRDMRNAILKEGPLAAHAVASVHLSIAAAVEVAMEAVPIRAKPWYRRSPRIIMSDLRAALMRRTERLRRYWKARRNRKLPEESEPKVTYGFYFDDAAWRNHQAYDLIRQYLDTLEPIVAEAEARFS